MTEPLRIGGPDDPLAVVWDAARAAADGVPVYAVGGPVRDLLRGVPARDADLAVEGDAAAFARRLADVLGGARVTAHRAFGTAVVRAAGVRVDVAATRRERYPHPGALPVVEPAGIEADLARRDFTVNALAVALTGTASEVLDPFGGRRDLDRGVIRFLHEASFRDDPTRVLRAVRYAARLGFSVDPETWDAAGDSVRDGLVGALSGARLRAEVVALLGESARTVAAALPLGDALGVPRALHPRLGAAAPAAPAVARLDGLARRLHRRAPAWRPRLALVLVAAGADLAVQVTERLRLRRVDAAAVRAAAAAPQRLGERLAACVTPADVAELLDRAPADVALVVAAWGGAGAAAAELYLERLRGIRLEIDGTVLRDELGLAQSPRVGEVLAELLRQKRNGQLADRGSELAAARELVGRAS